LVISFPWNDSGKFLIGFPTMASKQKALSFSRPPVLEALIDIRIEPLPIESLPVLENLHEKFSHNYPGEKPRYQWEADIKLSENELIASPKTQGPFGYRFESINRERLIQVRRDGFTLNQLKPDPNEKWPGWDILREEAKKGWNLFLEAFPAPKVTRIGIRYINQIVIPGEPVNLDEYLTAGPKIPSGLPQTLENFFNRVEFMNSEPGAKVLITQALSPKPWQGKVTITLDIDIFRENPKDMDDKSLWQTLDQFRILKNKIFLQSIKKKTKDLFK